MPQSQIDAVLLQTNLQSLDDLLEDIGLGNRMFYMIAQRLATSAERSRQESERAGKKPVLCHSWLRMVMNFGLCCHPIPGDPIVGHISSGRGMVIHTDDCNNIAEVRDNQEKCLEVSCPRSRGSFRRTRVELKISEASSRPCDYHHRRGSQY